MTVLIMIMLSFFAFHLKSYAQDPIGQIQRSEEILQQEEVLRKELEKPQQVFIKEIFIKGATSISEDEIKEITSPFIKRWLSKDDVQQIMDLIKELYLQKGQGLNSGDIIYKINKGYLEIEVNEIKNQKR